MALSFVAVAFVAPLVAPSADYSGTTVSGTAQADQIASLTEGRDCTPASRPRLVDHVIVSQVGFLSVREVDFDTAYALASNGTVEIKAYCA